MKKVLNILLLNFCLLFFFYTADAEALTERFSSSEIIELFKSEGYSAVDKVDDNIIQIKVDGLAYYLIIKDDGDLQAYYGIGDAVVTYQDINEWNATKRLSRAYIDSDHDPVIEADLMANGGLTNDNVTEFFSVFQISVRAFIDFVNENDKS